MQARDTHSVTIAYLLWLFGFFGAHRFYTGNKLTGLIWAFTFGLLFVGWIIDLFLIPGMVERAEHRYQPGRFDFTVAWLLHSFFLLGVFGLHRFYLGKWISGLVWLLTGGLLGFGFIYDWFTLNEQVSARNLETSLPV